MKLQSINIENIGCIQSLSFEDLDPNMNVITGSNGVGKTTLAVQIASNMQQKGKKILYVSNEMSDKEIYDKMIATRENIEFKKILNGYLDEQEYNRYATFYLKLAQEKNIEVIQESNINAVISKIKRQKSKNELDIVFIDYINKHLMHVYFLMLMNIWIVIKIHL